MGKTTTEKRMGRIVVAHGVQGELAKVFKTSTRTVYSALYGITHSRLAMAIRAAARQRGGFELPTDR